MTIPRLAIHRPVTMFMLSAVVILIGWIAFLRLPVDLMPDVSFPSITVRVGYAGVGPLEMEELVTRPLEQAMSAVAGLERLESTSSEGSSRVTLNFAWGTDLNEAADDVRNRLDRVRVHLCQIRHAYRPAAGIAARIARSIQLFQIANLRPGFLL